MNKLKIILHSDIFYLVCFFLPLILCFFPDSFSVEEYYKVVKVTEDKVILKGKNKILGYYEFDEKVGLNDKVKVSYEIMDVDEVTVYNTFSYKNYLKSEGIDAVVKINSFEVASSNKNILYILKDKIQSYVYSFNNGYLEAFILGDTGNIKLYSSYQKLGILSIFSVSGIHIWLLVSIFQSKKRLSFWFIMGLLFYLFITDFCVSATRSVLYLLLGFLKKKFDWNIKNENLLLLIGSFLLWLNPYQILSVGFQYSFFLSYMILKKKNLLKNRGTIFFSFFCFLCSFVITWYHFYEVNIFSFLYQIIYSPLVLGLFLGSFMVLLFPQVIGLYEMLISVLEFFSAILVKIPFDTIILGKPSFFVIFCFILVILVSTKPKHFIILTGLLITHFFFIYQPRYLFETLDVGQGDSHLIYVNRQCLMIDTGGFNTTNDDENKHFLSKNKIIPHLKSYGIRKIDVLLLTHGDYDHMGEAMYLVNNFKVGKVIFNCGEFNELERELIKTLNKKKIPYYSCIKELNINNNKLYFLNNKDYGNENDNSSVVYSEINGIKLLLMGDAGGEVEKNIIKKYNLKDIDILKIGHHGSKMSSSKVFIDEINPKYSIISVGKNNRYGHPNKEVLKNLKDSKVYRTDQDGSIMFKIKNNKLEIETCTP